MDNTTQEPDHLDEAPVLYWFKTHDVIILKKQNSWFVNFSVKTSQLINTQKMRD